MFKVKLVNSKCLKTTNFGRYIPVNYRRQRHDHYKPKNKQTKIKNEKPKGSNLNYYSQELGDLKKPVVVHAFSPSALERQRQEDLEF